MVRILYRGGIIKFAGKSIIYTSEPRQGIVCKIHSDSETNTSITDSRENYYRYVLKLGGKRHE